MTANNDPTMPSSTAFVHSNNVAVRLADIVPLLQHASRTHRGWLNDFADDIVQVPSDLYEVLVAYQSMVVNKAA